MTEFNLDDVDPLKRDVVILHTIQRHYGLVKANRILLITVFVLMSLVFVMGLVFIPRQNFLEQLSQQRQNIAYSTENPALTAEIKTLKGQMFGLVSGSIDSKIKSLEEAIRKGKVNESLDALQAIKGDVKILSSYSLDTAGKTEQNNVDQSVIKELSELKSLIYLTFISCGLMFAALAGIWLRHRYRISYQKRFLVSNK